MKDNCIGNLTKDIWAQIFLTLLQEQQQTKTSIIWQLSLVCKGFNQLLNQRPELLPYRTLKSRWLKIVLSEYQAEAHTELLNYLQGPALNFHIAKSGLIGFPDTSVMAQTLANNQTKTATILNSLNYLECQYLYLVEQTLLGGYHSWQGRMLTRARSMLGKSSDTLTTLKQLVDITRECKSTHGRRTICRI